jgi:hypothetical protein
MRALDKAESNQPRTDRYAAYAFVRKSGYKQILEIDG